MKPSDQRRWLDWLERLNAIAQIGLAYGNDEFDRERYRSIRTIAAEMAAQHSSLELGRALEILSADTGYSTPKVDVRAALFDGPLLLLVREREDGRWTLPGGWADVHDSPSEAVTREVLEETGLRATPRNLVAVYDRSKHDHEPAFPFHVYKMFFECSWDGEVASSSEEIQEVAFFEEDALPDLSLTRVTRNQIVRVFAHQRDGNFLTEFD